MLNITVIGAGYVGLVSAACFARLGFSVTCLDVDQSRVDGLKQGVIPIFEPGLDRLVATQAKAGRLRFSLVDPAFITGADIVFLAVGTPSVKDSDEADLSHIFGAARMIAPHLKSGAVVTTKSTVVAGTNRRIRATIAAERPDLRFSVVSNPEFLREGCAIRDFTEPDRVVVGHHDEAGRAAMETVYASFIDNGTPVIFTSLENAELIKYAANAFLALKISFINEVADLCEAAGGDVENLAQAIGLDPRIGERFLQAGPGFGGSCFPKDTRAFAATGRRLGSPLRLIETVVSVNEARKEQLAARVEKALGDCAGKTIAILGAAFKPDTDDVREAASLVLVPALAKAGARLRIYDPQVGPDAAEELRHASFASSLAEALTGADAAVLLTEWEEFRTLDPRWAREVMAGSLFVDFRNALQPAEMQAAGFTYVGIGRGEVPEVPEVLAAAPAPQRVNGSPVNGHTREGHEAARPPRGAAIEMPERRPVGVAL
ncbi:UDP-glucose dehydrogenase family protein [Mangrovicella endophytica]|uniref:UDP-glucose dehydrogenase family protein n=1 Tax=Mangrovicella endophytica TaxID=2066697 RepID=UPI000C9E6C98|nr:UDP-glucose/GDP-mannose dehydrogenase family protein [Mangrovicella endophytica]